MGMEWDLGFGNGMGMGFGNGIWEWDGIWDWGGIMTNGMGWDGYGMGFDTNGNWDSPIPISMGGKYSHSKFFAKNFLHKKKALINLLLAFEVMLRCIFNRSASLPRMKKKF